MDDEQKQLEVMDVQEMIQTARDSITAIKKNSKLRMHYLNMVHMNNTMRAFVHLYKLETHLEETQMLLLKTLIAVENRKNRAWFLADKAVLGKALEAYEALVTSATQEELTEVFEVKKRHHRDCKWLVHRDKDGALEITGCKSVLTVAL